MDRTAMFDALRPFAPGGKLKPEWVPHIDAVADLFGLPRSGSPTDPDPKLIAALKLDEGLRLKAYPDPLSPRAKTGKGSGPRGRSVMDGRAVFRRARPSRPPPQRRG